MAPLKVRYRQLLETIPSGFALHEIILDDSGRPVDYRFLATNPMFARLTGLDADAIVGKRVRQVIPAIESHWIETYGRVALTGETVRFESYSEPLGRHFDVVAFSPGRGYFAVVFQDVTERISTERLLQQARLELESRVRERTLDLEKANALLQAEIHRHERTEAILRQTEAQLLHSQKMESLGTLAGGVAHDFNNILMTILTNVFLMERLLGRQSDARALLDEIRLAADRAKELIADLQTFGRRQPIRAAAGEIDEILGEMEGLIHRLAVPPIVVRFLYGGKGLVVKVDRVQLQHVLINLLTNARDAMVGGGEITISTSAEVMPGTDGQLSACIQVTDTGHGMDEATLARIFDPFFTTKEVGKGTGLGLSTSYGIIREHGGTILAASCLGQGATFRLFLPIVSPEPQPQSRSRCQAVPGGGFPRPGSRGTLLLVEDDQQVRDALSEFLVRRGYRTLAAVDGEEAVRLFAENRSAVSLVLMDLVMPRLGGREAQSRILRIQPDIPILFMSGHSLDLSADSFDSRRRTGFVAKPINPEELILCIERLLGTDKNDVNMA
ncbi:MAG: response regulator [Magnetococcales bacterium]|nr:response regulator [Magnetococcales bacterium]